MTRLFPFILHGIVMVSFLFCPSILFAKKPKDTGEIVLGMSTALSGPAADLGKNMQRGVLTGLKRVNRSGGVKGRQLRLLTLDDGYGRHSLPE